MAEFPSTFTEASALEPRRILTPPERSVVRKTVEAMVTVEDDPERESIVAHTSAYCETMFATLPSDIRIQLRLLLVALWFWLPLLMGGIPLPYPWISPVRRVRLLDRMEGARFYVVRILVTTLKSMVTMAYFSHPTVRARLGIPALRGGRWQTDRISTAGLPRPLPRASEREGVKPGRKA